MPFFSRLFSSIRFQPFKTRFFVHQWQRKRDGFSSPCSRNNQSQYSCCAHHQNNSHCNFILFVQVSHFFTATHRFQPSNISQSQYVNHRLDYVIPRLTCLLVPLFFLYSLSLNYKYILAFGAIIFCIKAQDVGPNRIFHFDF